MRGGKPQLSQPDSSFPTTQHTQERDKVRELVRTFIDAHSSATKLLNSNAVPLHLQTLGLEKELFSQISHRDAFLSLNPSDQIYTHPSDYISHSKYGPVWGNRPQLLKTWVSLGQPPTIAHYHPLTCPTRISSMGVDCNRP